MKVGCVLFTEKSRYHVTKDITISHAKSGE